MKSLDTYIWNQTTTEISIKLDAKYTSTMNHIAPGIEIIIVIL